MQLTIVSGDVYLIAALSRLAPVLPEDETDAGLSSLTWEPEEPQRTPGATEGWWEMAVDFGLVGAPVGLLVNMLASWLFAAWQRSRSEQPSAPPKPTVTMVLRSGGLVSTVQIDAADCEATSLIIKTAFEHVHPEQ